MHKCGKLDIVEGSSVETVYLAWIIGQNFCRGVVRHDAGWMVWGKFVEALSDSIGAWDSGIPGFQKQCTPIGGVGAKEVTGSNLAF